MRLSFVSAIAIVLALFQIANAQVPQTLSYQGFLKDANGQPVNGNLPMTFRLFAQESGGAEVWGQSFPGVLVSDGVYNVILDVPNVPFDDQYWMETVINGQTGPVRTRLASSAYSLGPWTTVPPTQSAGEDGSGDDPDSPQTTANIYYNNGNVGIGMNNPFYKLDVTGQVRSIRNISTDIVAQTTGGTNAWAKFWARTPAQSWSMGTSQNFNLNSFYIEDESFGPTVRMYITPNAGEVGFPSPSSNHVTVKTSGGTNSWAQFRVGTASQTWYVGTSNNFNGNQLYFTDGGTGLIRMAVMPNGNVGIGTTNPTEKLQVAGRTKTQTLEITGGSDFSETFDLTDESIAEARPGMIVSIDPDQPGRLAVSKQAYDCRVAGIISGAGGVNPGMVMGQAGSIADGKHAVALSGRVYCWADAASGSIAPGDLLTASGTPGHAMKASDSQRMHGAIIGKAMTALKEGKGLVLVLVNLQ